jgi:beta-phosphoglucomutase
MKAVIFDLDGVITDTAHYHYIAWKNLANTLDIEVDLAFNEQLKGISRMESLERILEKGGRTTAFTSAEKMDLATKKNDEYIQLLENVDKKDVLPGILDLLKELKENNIKVAIASASKNAPMILEKLGVMTYIDAIADPEAVKSGKPAPDIFLEAARLIDVQPFEAIGVEDATAGVTAILAAGMKAVAVGTSPEIICSGANLIVPTTNGVTLTNLQKL